MPTLNKLFSCKCCFYLQVAQLKSHLLQNRTWCILLSSPCSYLDQGQQLKVHNLCYVAWSTKKMLFIKIEGFGCVDYFLSSLWKPFGKHCCFARLVIYKSLLSNPGQAGQAWTDLQHSQQNKGAVLELWAFACLATFPLINQTKSNSVIWKTCKNDWSNGFGL